MQSKSKQDTQASFDITNFSTESHLSLRFQIPKTKLSQSQAGIKLIIHILKTFKNIFYEIGIMSSHFNVSLKQQPFCIL